MSVYQKEPNSFNLQVPQKISVRNYFDKHRKKNKIADILIPDQLSIPSPQLTAKSPDSTFDHVQTPHAWKRNDNKGLKLNYNCFETTNNFKKPVERTPGYENNYRTPSTAY